MDQHTGGRAILPGSISSTYHHSSTLVTHIGSSLSSSSIPPARVGSITPLPRVGSHFNSNRLQVGGDFQSFLQHQYQQWQGQQQQQHTVQAGLSGAGLNLSSMGVAGGNWSSLFGEDRQGGYAGNDLMSGLQYLSGACQKKKSELWLRPDYHIPADKSYEEMSYRELVYGMVNVVQYLNMAQIPEITVADYLEHMKYICLKEIKPTYDQKAINKYEYDVTTKVFKNKIPKYIAGEHDAEVSNLGMEHTMAFMRAQQQLAKQQPAHNQGRQNQGRPRQNIQGYIPCPDHICKKWNFSLCDYQGCAKAHACAVCGGPHRGKTCAHNQAQGGQSQGQQHSQYQQYQQQAYQQQQGYQPGQQRQA